MRDIYKNPVFYYLFIPALVGFWPLLIRAVYLPRAEQQRDVETSLCVEGVNKAVEIIHLNPELLNSPDANQVAAEFAYPSAVDRVATLCRIPPNNWMCQAGNIIPSGGKKRQDALVKLSDVGIVQTAEFLTRIQSMWVSLTCEKIKLVKKRGMADQWNIDLNFVYYY